MVAPAAGDLLRHAGSSDHALVLELIREYFAYDEIAFHEPEIAAGLRTLLGDPSLGRVFLIRSGTEIAGYIILAFSFDLEYGGRQGTVTDFFLHEPYRRQGLGSLAFDELEKIGVELKLRCFELQAETDNHEAIAFYTKIGFRRHDRFALSKRLVPPDSNLDPIESGGG